MVVYHGQKPLRVLAQGLLVVNKANRCLPEVQGPGLTLDVRAGLEPLRGRRPGIKFEVGWDGHAGDTKQPGHLGMIDEQRRVWFVYICLSRQNRVLDMYLIHRIFRILVYWVTVRKVTPCAHRTRRIPRDF